jgi:tetratricopeptide (TPR) repeat protein
MRISLLRNRRFVIGLVLSFVVGLLVEGVARAQDETTAPAAEPETAATGEQPTEANAQEVLEKGQAALNEGDFETALKLFDQLARAGGQGITEQHFQLRLIGLTGRAQALIGIEEYEGALEDFKTILDLKEDFVPALIARGKMYLDIENPENYPAALADFQKAVKAERGNLMAQFGLGKAAIFTGNNQAGIGPLTRVLEAVKDNAEEFRKRGIDDAEAYRLRGMGYAGVFKFKEAIDDLQKAISIDPEDHEAYFTLGLVHLRNESFEPAVQEFAKAIEHFKPKPGEEETPYSQGYLTLSAAYIELGKASKDEAAKKAAFQASIDEIEKLLAKVDPKNPYTNAVRAAALHARGIGERMLGQVGKAIRTFSEAIELNPEMGEAYFRRGICFNLIGEDRMALKDFVEAANINYGDPRANLWEGLTHAKLGEYHEALRAYGNAIAASDRYTPAYYNRGLAYMALGDYEKAVADFTECIRFEPNSADFYFKRGLAQERLGDNQKASDSFTGAIERDEKHAAAHRHMADALQSLGRPQEANQYRQKATQLAAQQPAQ